MFRLFIISLLYLAFNVASAATTVSLVYNAPADQWAVGLPWYRHATDQLGKMALTSCPHGWEKLREYTTRDGDKYFLHFEIRCLGAAPSAAK